MTETRVIIRTAQWNCRTSGVADMTELTHEQLRRVLRVFAFDGCDQLFWRFDDGELGVYVQCSDFFAYACADVEPIKTENDVAALEQAHADLVVAESETYPMWTGELYAARRRHAKIGVTINLRPEVRVLFDAAAA